MKTKNIIIVVATVVVIAAVVCGIIVRMRHEARTKLEALIADNEGIEYRTAQLRNDLEKLNGYLEEENKHKFEASLFVGDLQTNGESDGFIWKSRSLRNDWLKALYQIGFDKQEEYVSETDQDGFDDESFDIYCMPFTLTTNGRTITVKAFYRCQTREQDGREISESKRVKSFDGSFSIKFSDDTDYNHFLQSLRDNGFVKVSEEYNDKIYNRYTDDSSGNVRVCPHVDFFPRDSLTISVNYYYDC